jgi:hypothetical protein
MYTMTQDNGNLKVDVLIIEDETNTLPWSAGYQAATDATIHPTKIENSSYTAAKAQIPQQQRNWKTGFSLSQAYILIHLRTEGRKLRNLESLSAT